MGEATFNPEIGPPQPVRPVKLEDLKATARAMRGVEGKEFSALLALKGALEANDGLALASAKSRLEEVYQLQQRERAVRLPEGKESRRKQSELWRVPGLSPEESLQHVEGLRPGPVAEKDLPRQLSWAVSRIISMWAQIVLWWVNGNFVPAIYCSGMNPSHAMKIALYVHTFLIAPNGEIGFRICPYDGEQFFQKQPNDEYCCPAHREAHRVKRWRNNKKKQQREKK